MNRETRIYFRKLRHGIRHYLTNNYRKLHGKHAARDNTLYRYNMRRKVHRKVPGRKEE